MKHLSINWLTEGMIDFEYKKYTLLAYLKSVKDGFLSDTLYPYFSDLLTHYQSLNTLAKSKDHLKGHLPKEFKGINWNDLSLQYQSDYDETEYMKVIDDLIHFAKPRMHETLEEGKERYETFENSLTIFPVGLLSTYTRDGFFILNQKSKSLLFQYNLNTIVKEEGNYYSIATKYLGDYSMGYTTTYKSIRKEVINQFREYDNPSTYVIETKVDRLPIKKTFLPIAKRSFTKYLLNL